MTMLWMAMLELATSRPAVSLTVLHPQIVAGHFFGLGNSEHPEPGVHGFDSVNCRLELAGVADHVSISEVDDDDVEYAILDGFHDSVGDSGCGHFRLQIVGGHFRRRNEDALFTGKWLLDAAVKE